MKKQDLFTKLQNIQPQDLKKLNITYDELEFIKNKLLNDKLGLTINFTEIDENLSKNYFGFEEITELNINPKDKDNNLIIEGDNYYALKALKTTNVKVDIIYIDPPYNTGKEFKYNDNRSTEVKVVGKDDAHKHSKWLSFMKKRLILAKELLTDNGVIFISINDNEQAYLKVLMDEIFGEENFVTTFGWQKTETPPSLSSKVRDDLEYILCYEKIINSKRLFKASTSYSDSCPLRNKGNKLKKIKFEKNVVNFSSFKNGIINKGEFSNLVLLDDIKVENYKNLNAFFVEFESKWQQEYLDNEIKKNTNILVKNHKKFSIRYLRKEESDIRPNKLLSIDKYDIETNEFATKELFKIIGDNDFDFPKNSKLIKFLIKITNSKNDALILDFFAGSGTTAQSVMELNQEDGGNRKFILVTNNEENIAQEICRERIYRVINGKGSGGELIDWIYSKDIKSLTDNHVKYLKVKEIDKVDGEYEDITSMKDLYKNEFNKNISIKDFNE